MEKKIFDFHGGEVLLVNKPIRWTSFDIVGKIRSCIGGKSIKVGHAGTLDPLADGLLIICTGKMTKQIDNFQALTKEYTGKLRLGATRPSFDMETEIDARFPYEHIDRKILEEKIETFKGAIQQISPTYSARRTQGVRAYEKARLGETIEIAPREVFIDAFEILDFDLPDVQFRIKCSKGTYIRSIARDLGHSLDSGAYLSQLTRTAIGDFTLENAWELGPLFEEIQNQLGTNLKRHPISLEENKQIRLYSQDQT